MGNIHNSSLARNFTRYALSTVPSRRNRELAMLSPRDFLDVPQSKRDLAWIGHCIDRSPAYQLDQNVVQAISKLWANTLQPNRKSKFSEILGKHPEIFTPVFPVMWLEIRQETTHVGYLLEALPNAQGMKGTLILDVEKHGVLPRNNDQIVTFTMIGNGKEPRSEFRMGNRHASFEEVGGIKPFSGMIVRATYATMILKSRTPILKLEEPEPDRGRKDAIDRIANGKAPRKPLGLIKFDISRTLDKGRAQDEEGAKKFLEEQIVMGHYKLREVNARDSHGIKTGYKTHELIWWNPHWRGGTDEEKAARAEQPAMMERDAKAYISKPDRSLSIPGYSFIPGDYGFR